MLSNKLTVFMLVNSSLILLCSFISVLVAHVRSNDLRNLGRAHQVTCVLTWEERGRQVGSQLTSSLTEQEKACLQLTCQVFQEEIDSLVLGKMRHLNLLGCVPE